MTLPETTTKNIIKKLMRGEDYRIEVISLLDTTFLEYAIDFFKRVVDAKLNNQYINTDWYKREFLSETLCSDEIAIHSGLNMKTISNMYNSGSREVVISASYEHYEQLYNTLLKLVDDKDSFDLTLTIKLRNISVELDISESLIVINSIAVKRAAIRGGMWSAAGKRVEKPLMLILCKLYSIPEKYFHSSDQRDSEQNFNRETDFYLYSNQWAEYKCEVKLMGKGNPESADTAIARNSKIFIADKLSETNKMQLKSLKVHWVELRNTNGFKKFGKVLADLKIPHKEPKNFDEEVLNIINQVLSKKRPH